MPGGPAAAYEEIRSIWEAIAAKSEDGPCVTYIGPGGSGHFLKTVHNGIEYGDMQLIAEAYDVMRKALQMDAGEIADVFLEWNKGILNSFLIETTSKVLRAIDPETGHPLIDLILDKAGQKGTGRWTVDSAAELGVPVPTIEAALFGRVMSSLKNERIKAHAHIKGPPQLKGTGNNTEIIDLLHNALYASKVCSYAQGFALISKASDRFGWKIRLDEVARIWKAGCIIRAGFLNKVKEAYRRSDRPGNLLLDPHMLGWIESTQHKWRKAISLALEMGIPVPAMSASLAYFDSYRSADLPQNLTQAQRDFFGAHTYERKDKPELGAVHTDWNALLK
jgi:6-phosphogluconate dehydrogenase